MTKKWEMWEVESLIPSYQKQYPHKNDFVIWNNTLLFRWEYELLKYIEAIDDDGILNNYPILQVGDDIVKDYNGDIEAIKYEIENINQDKRITKKAKISWCPRGYSLWVDLNKKRDEAETAMNNAKKKGNK